MKEWFDYLIDSIFNIVAHVMLDIREIFWDFFFFILEKILDFSGWLSNYVLSTLPDFDASSYWASVPADVIALLNFMKFGECMAIIIGAIGVRFILNLIPFIRA